MHTDQTSPRSSSSKSKRYSFHESTSDTTVAVSKIVCSWLLVSQLMHNVNKSLGIEIVPFWRQICVMWGQPPRFYRVSYVHFCFSWATCSQFADNHIRKDKSTYPLIILSYTDTLSSDWLRFRNRYSSQCDEVSKYWFCCFIIFTNVRVKFFNNEYHDCSAIFLVQGKL